jgi:hypothetical protein
LSQSGSQKIDATTVFPADESKLKAFVLTYIGSLRLTEKFSMRGKVIVCTKFKIAALNKNKHIVEFLQGKWSEGKKATRVKLSAHLLECNIRHQVGFFLNTLTRFDMVTSLSERIAGWFDSWKEVMSKDFPAFQVEVQTVYRGQSAANYYRIMAAKGGDSGNRLVKTLP